MKQTCARYSDKLTTIAYNINLNDTKSAACKYKARKWTFVQRKERKKEKFCIKQTAFWIQNV